MQPELSQPQLTFVAILMPILMALIAVGAVLAIKIHRRREGPAPAGMDAVPMRPMSAQHAHLLMRRYAWSAVAVLAALLVVALVVF